MASPPITVDVPDLFVALLGSPEAVAGGMRRALVLALLRQAKICQGRAAELLGITRWDIIALMAEYDIPMGPRTAEEMQEEIEMARQMARQMRASR